MHEGFEIHCDAGATGAIHTLADAISVRIGQRIGPEATDLWDSIIIVCENSDDGIFSAKIIVCHPDWEKHLQIAHIRSGVFSPDSKQPSFEMNLASVRV